jgi:hypothetical protein
VGDSHRAPDRFGNSVIDRPLIHDLVAYDEPVHAFAATVLVMLKINVW